MPLYQFFCKRCKKPFELFIPISEAKQGGVCPYCNGTDIERPAETGGENFQDTSDQTICGIKKDT